MRWITRTLLDAYDNWGTIGICSVNHKRGRILCALRADVQMPGAARQQVTLFCLSKIEVTKQKDTHPHRPCGLPTIFRKDRAAAELARCAQTAAADGSRSLRKIEAAQRGIRNGCVGEYSPCFPSPQLSPRWGEGVTVPSPSRGRPGWGWGVWFEFPLSRRRAAEPSRGISARTV